MRYLIAARDKLREAITGYTIYITVEIQSSVDRPDKWYYKVCTQKGNQCLFFEADTMDEAVDAAIERHSN